jgi:hypothetical protein
MTLDAPPIDRLMTSPHKYIGRKVSSRGMVPVPIARVLIHSTRGGVDDGGDYARTLGWFANTDSQVSAHMVIGHDGELARVIDDADGAWHAGDGSGPMNLGALAVELAQELPTTPYTDAQINKLAQVVAYWCDKYIIPAEYLDTDTENWWTARGITYHETYDASPGAYRDFRRGKPYGKSDPGFLALEQHDRFFEGVHTRLALSPAELWHAPSEEDIRRIAREEAEKVMWGHDHKTRSARTTTGRWRDD